MRYSLGSVLLLSLMVSSVSAQPRDQSVNSEAQDPMASTEVVPDDPSLEPELNDDSVRLPPGSYRLELESRRLARTADSDSKAQLRPARAGVAVSVVSFAGGVTMMGAAFANVGDFLCMSSEPQDCATTPTWVPPVATIGALISIGGLVGVVVSGRRLSRSKEKLRWYADAVGLRRATPRRVQLDPHTLRFVF